MSWRRYSQPERRKRPAKAQRQTRVRESLVIVVFNLGDVRGVEALQEAGAIDEMKLRVGGLDAQEEAVSRSMLREARDVENGMMRARELVHGDHAEDGEGGSAENGEFECDGNEGRPTVGRAAGDIDGIGVKVDPILKEKAGEAAHQAAEKSDGRHPGTAQAEGFGKAFDGIGSVGVDVLVAGEAGFFGGLDQLLGRLEFSQETVNVRARLVHLCSSDACSEVWATNSRISAMEMAGRTRTNKKIKVVKRPRVPVKVAQSQMVGW